jgi:hypothetical protein
MVPRFANCRLSCLRRNPLIGSSSPRPLLITPPADEALGRNQQCPDQHIGEGQSAGEGGGNGPEGQRHHQDARQPNPRDGH